MVDAAHPVRLRFVVMIPGTHVVALLCVLPLPIWLLLAGQPEMLIEKEAL